MTEAILSVRASALNKFADCPRREVLQHLLPEVNQRHPELNIEKARTFSPNMHVGNMLHQVMYDYLNNEQGTTDYHLELEGIWDKHEQIYASGPSNLQLNLRRFSATAQALTDWLGQHASLLKPMTKETQMKKIWGEIEITGKPDLIDDEAVIDLKTGKLKDFSRQVAAYAELRGIEKAKLQILHLPISQSPSGVEIIEYDHATARQEALAAVQQMAYFVKLYRARYRSLDLPANPESNMCSQSWCSVWGTPLCGLGKGSNSKLN